MKVLKKTSSYVLYIPEVEVSYSIDEYADERGVRYYTKSGVSHFIHITKNYFYGHSLKEAKRYVIQEAIRRQKRDPKRTLSKKHSSKCEEHIKTLEDILKELK